VIEIRKRLALLGAGVAYFVLFRICYDVSIATNYDYYGFGLNTLASRYHPFFWVAALVPLAYLPLALKLPSDTVSWLLYLLVAGPTCFLAPNLTKELVDAVVIVFVFLICHGLFEYFRRRKSISVNRSLRGGALLRVGLPAFMLTMIGVVLFLVGFNIDLSYANMYDRRVAARGILPGRTGVDYAVAIFSSTAVPISLTLGYTRKRAHLLLLGIAGTLMMFSLTGEKTTIFTPLLVVSILFLATRFRRSFGLALVLLTCCLFAAATLQTMIFESDYLTEVFVRRRFAIPALLSVKYLEYFNLNSYLLYKNTFIGSIFFGGDIQSVQGSFMVGEEYFRSETNAGANLWATGFSHLGYFGMAFSSVLAAYIAKLFDGMTFGDDLIEVSVVCALIGSRWAEAGLHTSLLTHGVLAALVVVYLLPHRPAGRARPVSVARSSVSWRTRTPWKSSEVAMTTAPRGGVTQ